MNIFVLSKCPFESAEMLCDKHVVKMLLETAQILSTAAKPFDTDNVLYKPAYIHHPCVKWASLSKQNFGWLVYHGLGLCLEYTKRYSKRHKSERVIDAAWSLLHKLPDVPMTPFVQAMPNKYKQPCPVAAYRSYYLGEKMHFAKWTARPVPTWIEAVA